MTIESGKSDLPRVLVGNDLERAMAEVEKGQQLAGHFSDASALDRARRILTGKTSFEDALCKFSGQMTSGCHAKSAVIPQKRS